MQLGLEVKADDVSTVLIGQEPALFEAIRVAFGRCACTESVRECVWGWACAYVDTFMKVIFQIYRVALPKTVG